MLIRSVAALALIASVIGGSAYAADVARPIAPPTAVPVVARAASPFDGFYLGGNAGYGSASRSGCAQIFWYGPADCDVADKDFDYTQKGWLLGGQVGVNHVLSGSLGGHGLVIGAEINADLSGVTGNLNDAGPFFSGVGDWNWLATGMAKLGLVSGNWMIYAQGGAALGGFTYNSSFCNFTSNNQGWAYGAGAAVASGGSNSVFLDWTHADFQNKDAMCGDLFGTAVKTKPSIDIVKVGFNHSFH